MGELSSPSPLRTGEAQLSSHNHTHSGEAQVVGGEVKEAIIAQENVPGPPQLPTMAHHAFSSQLDMPSPHTPYRQQGPYDMAPIANCMPAVGYRPSQFAQGGQRYIPTTSPQMIQQMPQMPPYGGPPPVPMNQGFYVHQTQMPQYYSGHMPPCQGPPPMPLRQNVAYYPNRMMVNHPHSAFYYAQANSYPGQPQSMPVNMIPGHSATANPPTADVRRPRSTVDGPGMALQAFRQGRDEPESQQGAVRGPPRKPRQSGHAIWIGNLPPQTDLMSLVHHACKEAPGLESLFLISKSNCAFANFKDEGTCLTAQQKLHDSKFQSVRLVSRLRKSTVEGATGLTAPTGPAASTAGVLAHGELAQDGLPSDSRTQSPAVGQPKKARTNSSSETNLQQDKFFILKSLTMEDLELSVRTGIWATQPHNEKSLNSAFKSFENVYLIFSANKSGEYFGYARMVSEINEDPDAAIEFAPKAQVTSSLDLPKAIATDATEYVPRGRIIDDSARGTIFWEAEREDSESGSDSVSEVSSNRSAEADEDTKTWGKPFKLEWLSISRLPFYRTRGLRNPWNSNREVKIARDGTELEPSVGRRLIGLFNRVQSPGPVQVAMRPAAMAMAQGFPPMRAHGQ